MGNGCIKEVTAIRHMLKGIFRRLPRHTDMHRALHKLSSPTTLHLSVCREAYSEEEERRRRRSLPFPLRYAFTACRSVSQAPIVRVTCSVAVILHYFRIFAITIACERKIFLT